MRLAGKVAVVTGSGSGVGRAAALLFHREGAAVVAGSIEPDVAKLVGEAVPGRDSIVPVRMDVTIEDDVQRLIGAAVERFGGLDILFNNAGIETSGVITEVDDETWRRTMDVNLRGVVLCCRHAIPEMLKRGGGAIVNNASINGIRGNHNLVAYSASKGAVVALTRALALDYATCGIRVNCLCPGAIEDTQMVQGQLARSDDAERFRASLIAKHPLGRLARASEVAAAALFLASAEASFITGVALPVDGGRHIR